MKLGLRFSAVFFVVVPFVACGGDDGGGGSGGSSSGGSTAGGGSSGGGSGGGSSGGASGSTSGGAGGASGGASGAGGAATGGSSSGGAAGSNALAECKAKAASNPNPGCANCACDKCLSQLVACEEDATCVALRDCAQKNNCCDELCVALKCGKELGAAGGIDGAGTKKASAVKDCTQQGACNCCK